MALTVARHLALAQEASHSGTGKTVQALDYFNSILSDLCQERDFAEARGQYNFNFTQQEPATTGFPAYPANQFGSGPWYMPVDYLRLSPSGGSFGAQRAFVWWLNGVPYPVIPMDLAEFDLQVQQTGLQSFVWLSATDMSAPIDDRILLKTTADTTAGSTSLLNIGSVTRLIGGGVLGVAGQGIRPGTLLLNIVHSSGGIDTPGGGGISTPGGGGIETPGGAGTVASLTLSMPANATISGASIFFGYPPAIYIYPPPNSSLQAMIRYQKQMPDVVDTSRIPWCRYDGYLQKKLIGRLCLLNDDDRANVLLGGPDIPGSAEAEMTNYLAMKDDEPSHPKRVELDRRYFGRGSTRGEGLRITKTVGW